LSESSDLYDVRIYLVCLMDNHFHLVAETPRGNISQFMHSVLTGYSLYFNLKHNTCGHVFQGRYGSELVEGNEYLLQLSRYVHLNPVCTREHKKLSAIEKARYLRSYRWSTYRGYYDKKKRWGFVEYDPTLSLMNSPKREQPQAYQQFVETGLAETDDEFVELMKKRTRCIGSKDFRKWVDKEYENLKKVSARGEDVSFRRESELVDVAGILEIVSSFFGMELSELKERQYNSIARPVAARMLCKHAGLNQREAADVLGYGTGAAVSYQLKKLSMDIGADKKKAKQMGRIEKEIKGLNI
jgi:putative transposase